MKDNRKFNKEEYLKKISTNEELLKFVETLKEGEIERIKQTRTFDSLSPGSNRWKIALLCDPLRQQLNLAKSKLEKRLWTIKDLNNKINRLNIQLTTGIITEKLNDNITMNQPEVESLIQNSIWLMNGEFNAVRLVLAEISGLVGHHDYIKNQIITLEQFDNLVEETNIYLNKYGYRLFGELNE